MKLLETLMYDPRKFFGAVIIFFWALPILIIGLVSVSANAASGADQDSSTSGGSLIAHTAGGPMPADTVSHKTYASTTRTVHSCRSMDPDSDSDAGSAGQDDQGANSCTTVKKQTSHTTVQTPQPVHQTVIYKTVPQTQTKVIERQVIRNVPQNTQVIRFVPQPSNNSASASAAASAVVNVAAQPQLAAVNTANYTNDNTASTSTTAAAGDNTSASTNVVYQTPAPAVSNVSYGKSLPNTGAGDVISVAGISTVIAALAHYFYRRRLAH